MEKRDVYTALKEKVLDKILEGKKQFVVWGYSTTGAQLLADLHAMGLLDRVTGIISSDAHQQGQTIFCLPVLPPQEIGKLPLDVLVIASDEEKEAVLRQFALFDHRMPDVVLSGSKHYAFRNSLFEQVTITSPVRSKAGGYSHMLIHIFQALEYLVRSNLEGAVAEFGVFQGGTSVIIAKSLRRLGWEGKIYGFDLFGASAPKRSVMDVFPPGKYSADFETVKRYCEPYGIEVIQGDICETFQILKGIPLMFSFFDTDYYSPTRAALDMCYEQTVKGGVIAFDHYFSEGWEDTIGERIAAKEVLEGKPVFHLHGTGIFLKLE
jgi:O-methyltransferase